MAIVIPFGGVNLYAPGSYSEFTVDNSAGAPLANNDTILIVGEAAKGAPGSVEGIVEFSAARLNSLIAKYGSGPIVDCALAAARPSRQQGVGGAARILVYKTNASSQAAVTLQNGSAEDLFAVKDSAYGVEGNTLSIVIQDGSSANQKAVSVTKLGGTTESLGENADENILSIQYTGDASTAEAEISGVSRAAMALTTTLAGDQTDGSADLNIVLANYTVKELVDFINSQTGYVAVLQSVSKSVKKANELDPVSVADITSASSLKRLQYEILEVINSSARVEATLAATPVEGVAANVTGALVGGAQGASTNTNFANGFAASLANDYNVLLPAISRDASEDIADANLGFTDAASTYDLASVIAACDTHLRLRGSVQNRREAQGMGGVRKAAKADAFAFAANVGSELMQIAMQDVVVLDQTSTLSVKMPHVMAALMAGIRLGTEVGEPMTHKFINVSQIGHIIDPVTRQESGDFNVGLDTNEAIINGVTFAQNAQGGYRIVVDNTTYGVDNSFVFNRGSVLEASFYVFRVLRETAEQIFVGKKVSNGTASSIKSAVRNKLRELNQPDVNIITSSNDAPEGFVEETFVVEVNGNVATVQVEFKPVQGLDMVLFSFTLGDIQQSA